MREPRIRQEISNPIVTCFVMGFGIGSIPVFLPPSHLHPNHPNLPTAHSSWHRSEIFGRRSIHCITMFLYFIFTLPSALAHVARTLIVPRMIADLATSPPITSAEPSRTSGRRKIGVLQWESPPGQSCTSLVPIPLFSTYPPTPLHSLGPCFKRLDWSTRRLALDLLGPVHLRRRHVPIHPRHAFNPGPSSAQEESRKVERGDWGPNVSHY